MPNKPSPSPSGVPNGTEHPPAPTVPPDRVPAEHSRALGMNPNGALSVVSALEDNHAASAFNAIAGLVPALAGSRQTSLSSQSTTAANQQIARQMAALFALSGQQTAARVQPQNIPFMSIIGAAAAASANANATAGAAPAAPFPFRDVVSPLSSVLGVNVNPGTFPPPQPPVPQANLRQTQVPRPKIEEAPPVPARPQPAAAPTVASLSTALFPNMQNWSIKQLEQHVALLRQLNQPVPQNVSILLSEMRRKEDKRAAKRVANRKSASTSRARKKALVEDMTKTNARLRRQALILALLPDMVIVTSESGEITFCSAQVERTLRHKSDDLIGSKLYDLLTPSSRSTLQSVILKLQRSSSSSNTTTRSRAKRRATDPLDGQTECSKKKAKRESSQDSNQKGSRSTADTTNVVPSDQSFPLSVVEVESKGPIEQSRAGDNFLPMTSLSSEDDSGHDSGDKNPNEQSKASASGKESAPALDAKRIQNAYENLDRNVRWHNERLKGIREKANSKDGPKDDVTGESVTKNNATARLSSLKHVPKVQAGKGSPQDESMNDQSSSDDSLLAGVEEKKKSENASDDSGYRESNDSREETSSSSSDTSNSNVHRSKFAPTCKICLIRDDLTTLWCEVATSIRSGAVDDSVKINDFQPSAASRPSAAQSIGQNGMKSPPDEPPAAKEFLFCLRPIRDGDKVAESFQFSNRNRVSESSNSEEDRSGGTTQSGGGSASSGDKAPPTSLDGKQASAGAPKRHSKASSRSSKGANRTEGSPNANDDTERSVVESLMSLQSPNSKKT